MGEQIPPELQRVRAELALLSKTTCAAQAYCNGHLLAGRVGPRCSYCSVLEGWIAAMSESAGMVDGVVAAGAQLREQNQCTCGTCWLCRCAEAVGAPTT